MEKYAIVTGASSGLGKQFAYCLFERGYSLVLVSRNGEKLDALKCEFERKDPSRSTVVLKRDLSDESQCMSVASDTENLCVEIVVNNAGTGVVGEFTDTDMSRELELIDTNIKAVHMLTKIFVRRFSEKNYGYILNVASAGSFLPGPLFAAYYASKSYVYRLTQAVQYELSVKKSGVRMSVLCPGPVKTQFSANAGVHDAADGLDAGFVAGYAVKKMLAGKKTILPGFSAKAGLAAAKIIPDGILEKFVYRFQRKKL